MHWRGDGGSFMIINLGEVLMEQKITIDDDYSKKAKNI